MEFLCDSSSCLSQGKASVGFTVAPLYHCNSTGSVGAAGLFFCLSQSLNVSEFMNVILSVHGKFQGMVREVFGGHQRFHSALDRVGTVFSVMV